MLNHPSIKEIRPSSIIFAQRIDDTTIEVNTSDKVITLNYTDKLSCDKDEEALTAITSNSGLSSIQFTMAMMEIKISAIEECEKLLAGTGYPSISLPSVSGGKISLHHGYAINELGVSVSLDKLSIDSLISIMQTIEAKSYTPTEAARAEMESDQG